MTDYLGFFALGWIASCILLCALVVYVHKNPDHRQKHQATVCAFGWWLLPIMLLSLVSEKFDLWVRKSPWAYVLSVFIWMIPIYVMAITSLGWAACNTDICAVGLGDFVIGWFRG